MWAYKPDVVSPPGETLQLDFNYDLYGMNAAQILALLPEEFEAWRATARASQLAAPVSRPQISAR